MYKIHTLSFSLLKSIQRCVLISTKLCNHHNINFHHPKFPLYPPPAPAHVISLSTQFSPLATLGLFSVLTVLAFPNVVEMESFSL